MIAASRIVNIGRTVMPYATWAAYVIQLGYVGYNLYVQYQNYLAQVERDQRSNTTRSLDETIELVIAPRRRGPRQQNTSQEQTATIQDEDEAQTDEDNIQPTTSAGCNQGTSNSNHQENDHDDNLSDNRHMDVNQENSADRAEPDRCLEREVNPLGSRTNVNEDIEEVSTDASLSLESTDSNQGIVKDMYNECFICARTLNDPSKEVATLPFCMHPFHRLCLDGVLKWHQKCPVCDFHIFSPI